jgi:hypothetical protein
LLELPLALSPDMRATASALPSTLLLSRRLYSLFGSRITNLPRATRRLLLYMALDGTGDLRVLEAAGASAGFRDLTAAEAARIAYRDEEQHRLAFRHPLMRSAVVELSRAEERHAAHRALADVWADQPDRRAWHLAEATVDPDEAVASQLEAAAARILARGDPVGCVKALTRSSELSPRNADRQRRLAAAAYIGADVTGDLTNAHHVVGQLRRGDTEVEGYLMAAVAASVFLLQGDGDVTTAHRLLVAALENREGGRDGRDPVVAEALYSLMMVCSYSGEQNFWLSFNDAIARTQDIPPPLALGSKTFADPAHAGSQALDELDVGTLWHWPHLGVATSRTHTSLRAGSAHWA